MVKCYQFTNTIECSDTYVKNEFDESNKQSHFLFIWKHT